MKHPDEFKAVLVLVGIFLGCWALFLGLIALFVFGLPALWEMLGG